MAFQETGIVNETNGKPDKKTKRASATPRQPSRGRGMLRYESLIDSTEILLRERNADEVGLYQIAEHAGVPSASVYHFFPTKEAAFAALAQRYLRGFAEQARKPIDPGALYSWQGLMAWDQLQAIDYYHANPPAMTLFMGRYGGLETRKAEAEHNGLLAARVYRRLNSLFHMPALRDTEEKFHIYLEIVDAVLALSFVKHGKVTDDYRQQAWRASTAYCRLFLPEVVELRDEFREAVARGEPVIAPVLPVEA
jgi:AcrR family transcriptional regulator